MRRVATSRAAPRRTRGRRLTSAVALAWLVFNVTPSVLALGARAGGGPPATDEDVWLEPRHLDDGEEECERSRLCLSSSPGSHTLLALPAARLVTCLDPRDAEHAAHAGIAAAPRRFGPGSYQPRAPPPSCRVSQ